MKSTYTKKLVFILSTIMILFALNGCNENGKSGISSQNGLLGDPLTKGGSYPITVHAGNESVVHSHTSPPTSSQTTTHSWTQVAGPTVTLTNTNTPTVTIQTNTNQAGSTVVLQHTVTSNGASNTTHHQVKLKPLDLNVTISYDHALSNGQYSSFHASVIGGTPPYTYKWEQKTLKSQLPFKIIDDNTSAPEIQAPLDVKTDETVSFMLYVQDKANNSKDIGFEITISNKKLLATPTITINSQAFFSQKDPNGHRYIKSLVATCHSNGGLPPFTYEWHYYPSNLIDEFDITEIDDKITFESKAKSGSYTGISIGCKVIDDRGDSDFTYI